MKKLDYKKFQDLSKRMGISVYTLIKRELNYRLSYTYESCETCDQSNSVYYKDGEHTQCRLIGIMNDRQANIDMDFVCDRYSKSFWKWRLRSGKF